MKALRAVLVTEDDWPVEIAGLDLADGGMAAIVASGSGAHAESALGEVEAVADGAADAIKRNPAQKRGIYAALQDTVFNKTADGVVGQCGSDGRAQTEAAPKAAGDVVLAAAFPDSELARWCGMRLSPGSRRSMTSPRLRQSQRRFASGSRMGSIFDPMKL